MGVIDRLISTVYTGCMTMKETLAYVAGFIDGEGYLGIKKYDRHPEKGFCPTYSERISVAGVNEQSIRDFNKIVPGHIYLHKPSKLSKRGYWSWEVTESKARIFLQKIYPYLKVKKPEAELIIKLSENKLKTKSAKISSDDRDLRERLYLSIKELHNGT
jgi:hypothetical protein